MPPFEEIVVEHGLVVMRVCRALLEPNDAEDAWSETFLAALRAYPDLRTTSNVRAWLVTIAHHKAIDELRRAKRTDRSVAEVPDTPVWDDLSSGPDASLRAALDALPTKQRWAVVHRYLGDLSYADVATLLDSNVVAARRSAADGIARLRKTYTKEMP